MFKKVIFVGMNGLIVAVLAVIFLKNRFSVGHVIFGLSLVPLTGLFLAKRSFRSASADLIFGAIDTGLLTIPVLFGSIFFGVAGAITGGIIGDALADGVAGFFEGSIAVWLRSRGIEESREPITTALGKMAGCLLGSGFILTLAFFFGIRPEFK